jgi:2-C-methyl-D-erythritol 4-phosphate cytidylyltransferase/2-C-methyl-D-erythritol 2,4-cyclodiphosphate synthase
MMDFTDDAGLAEWAGLPVKLVASSSLNLKLTTAQDIALAERLLAPQARTLETRTGNGFDVHAFCAGDHVWLGGIKIAHTHGLAGHSDADVALHALTDALLGAIGEGDIGEHFPPSDPQWRGAPSRIFLADAARRVKERGARIANVDITLLCEEPKIGPHRAAMRATIASILGIEPSRVGVKATTTEGLGFLGRREGIAALASATIATPV